MTISLIDETFNPHNSEHYKIAIQVLPDGFSFVIFDSVRNKFVLLKHSDFKKIPGNYNELKTLFYEEELLKLNFQSKKIFVFSDKTTIIPDPFSLKEKTNQFLKFTTGQDNSELWFQSKAPFGTGLAYSIPGELNELISIQNSFKTYPLSYAVLFEAYKNKLIKKEYTGVFLYIIDGYAHMVVLRSGELLFFNVFPYNTSEDLCYFLLYVYDIFKFDKAKDVIQVSGIIPKTDSRIKALSAFFKKIEYAQSEKQYIYSYRFNEVPQHYFSNLFLTINEDY